MDHVRVPNNSYIFEYPWNLVSGKMQRPFLKKISQSKSDKPSCRCKNGGGGGGGGSAHRLELIFSLNKH